MKVLLYGGTFDPPHNGHLNNLRAAAARVQPDKVVVMPAGLSPFKQKTSAPGALRLEMCSCFHALEEDADTIPQLEVSGWEIEQAAAGNRNYTVLTVEKLARENPGAQLYLAIGSDMLLSFDGWHRWQDILRLAHLVVTSRHVGDDPELHAKALRLDPTGARILFAPVQALPMASSDIRTRLTAGEGCEADLPEAVRAIGEAELILLGPGSLYTSVIPNLLVDGIADAVRASDALKIYICNIMTQDGETEGMTASDHVKALLDHSGPGLVDLCLCNSAPVRPGLVERYREEDAAPIVVDRAAIEALGVEAVTRPLASETLNYARHSFARLAEAVMELYNERADTKIF